MGRPADLRRVVAGHKDIDAVGHRTVDSLW
jgi:hypothetical protein